MDTLCIAENLNRAWIPDTNPPGPVGTCWDLTDCVGLRQKTLNDAQVWVGFVYVNLLAAFKFF